MGVAQEEATTDTSYTLRSLTTTQQTLPPGRALTDNHLPLPEEVSTVSTACYQGAVDSPLKISLHISRFTH